MAAGPEGAEGVVIRPAEEGDLPELLAIYNHEVANGTATYDLEPATLAERAAWMAAHDTGEAALTGTHPLVVAALPEDGRPGGRAAGYASLSPYRGKGGYAASPANYIFVVRLTKTDMHIIFYPGKRPFSRSQFQSNI